MVYVRSRRRHAHCFYCGRILNLEKYVKYLQDDHRTKDHVVLLVLARATRPLWTDASWTKNLVDCCHKCNRLKNDLSPEEWLWTLNAHHRDILVRHLQKLPWQEILHHYPDLLRYNRL